MSSAADSSEDVVYTEGPIEMCPTCGRDDFDSENLERSIKIHHSRSHGASLSKRTTCEYEHCEEEITSYKDRKYCSQECYGLSNRDRVTLTCGNCGDTFEVPPSEEDNRVHCSNKCRTEAEHKDLVCDECGTTFSVRASEAESRQFCSKSCRSTSIVRPSKVERVQLTCEWCGNTFERRITESDTAKCCSASCQSRYAASGERVERVTLACEWCGDDYQRLPSEAESSRFCSISCSARYNAAQMRTRVEKTCPVCYIEFDVIPVNISYRRCCSRKCANIYQRKEPLYAPRPPCGEEAFYRLVDHCYFHDGFDIDTTYRIVSNRLDDGYRWERDDVEDLTGELLQKTAKVSQRLLAIRPEDIGLSPLGEGSGTRSGRSSISGSVETEIETEMGVADD